MRCCTCVFAGRATRMAHYIYTLVLEFCGLFSIQNFPPIWFVVFDLRMRLPQKHKHFNMSLNILGVAYRHTIKKQHIGNQHTKTHQYIHMIFSHGPAIPMCCSVFRFGAGISTANWQCGCLGWEARWIWWLFFFVNIDPLNIDNFHSNRKSDCMISEIFRGSRNAH